MLTMVEIIKVLDSSNPLAVGPTTALFIFVPFVVVAMLNKLRFLVLRVFGHETQSTRHV